MINKINLWFLLMIVFLALASGCSKGDTDALQADTPVPPDTVGDSGTLGGPCTAEGTCNPGLVCEGGICNVSPDGTGEDTEAPSVSITSPFAGQIFTRGGPLAITADASDDQGVAKVEFYDGDTKIGEDTDPSNGWSYSWAVTFDAEGTRTLTARASDFGGRITASAPVIITVDMPSFSETIPGGGTTYGYAVDQTSDGGYIVAARSDAFGAGTTSWWVIKLDADGGVEWQRAYGGDKTQLIYSISGTSDGYIVAGDSNSFGSDPNDLWLIRLNTAGDIVWQKVYTGDKTDSASAAMQTADGGYVVAGNTYSFGASTSDAWVIKLNAEGGIIWQKRYGGRNVEYVNSMKITSDGGYILAGNSDSFMAGSLFDFWVLKLKNDGSIEWQKVLGGDKNDVASVVRHK